VAPPTHKFARKIGRHVAKLRLYNHLYLCNVYVYRKSSQQSMGDGVSATGLSIPHLHHEGTFPLPSFQPLATPHSPPLGKRLHTQAGPASLRARWQPCTNHSSVMCWPCTCRMLLLSGVFTHRTVRASQALCVQALRPRVDSVMDGLHDE